MGKRKKDVTSINDILQLAILAAMAGDFENAGKLLRVVGIRLYQMQMLKLINQVAEEKAKKEEKKA